MRWKCLEQLDVGRQCNASEDTFKQVMTQHRVVRDLIRQRRLERVEIINALAGIRAFLEQILIHIRDGRCIRIDTAGTGERPLEARAVTIGGRDGHTVAGLIAELGAVVGALRALTPDRSEP